MRTRFICPDTAAPSKGYTRSHGAIALARFEERQILSGLSCAVRALRYTLGTPRFGTRAVLEWIQRRRVRGRGALS